MLGGLQGLLGWVMVASGLVDQPQVSHFRLAAHLVLAFFILAYFWRMAWLFLNSAEIRGDGGVTESYAIKSTTREGAQVLRALSQALGLLLVLLIIQIVYGAFVAGLRAGFMYNTFPGMEGQFFPQGAWLFSPGWRNLFENPLLVQWIHRTLGWGLLVGSLLIYGKFHKQLANTMQWPMRGLVLIVLVQFGLGVFTLLSKVSLPLAVIHQVGAGLVLMFLLWLRWEVKKNRTLSRRE